MMLSDIEREPCGCVECQQAGVVGLKQRRDPRTGMWLHAYDLKRWYAARDAFRAAARKAIGGPGRHSRMERMCREPGEEG